MKVYVPFDQGMPEDDRIIIPYTKKEDKWITGTAISSVQILRGNISTPPPPCEYTHNVPAIVFSSGGSMETMNSPN
ncbi:hypothetical protein RHGRI_032459 [Rhododendron griersonianum]|uniref:Uncharacterized protein n=1 Tax=Rhododendron griersonianum TaxID=479676 RepID=A0AAV6IGR7_9ERIC|nr:hypothetical protein RHGRI_032459 [Rhododendron griersonianum]